MQKIKQTLLTSKHAALVLLCLFISAFHSSGYAATADRSKDSVIIKPLRSIPVGQAEAITIDPAHNHIIAAYGGWTPGRIDVFDLKTGQQVKSVTLTKPFPPDKTRKTALFGGPSALTFDEHHNHIFVADGLVDQDGDYIYVLDGTTLAHVASIHAFNGQTLQGVEAVAIDSKNNRLIASDTHGVEFFDLSTLKYSSSLPIDPTDPLYDDKSSTTYYIQFIGFDPVHRTFLLRISLRSAALGKDVGEYRKNIPDYKACVAVFSIDTGKRVGAIGSCEATDGAAKAVSPAVPPQSFSNFAVIASATVVPENNLLVIADSQVLRSFFFMGKSITRVRFFDSETLRQVGEISSDGDPNITYPYNMVEAQGSLFILSNDPVPSTERHIEIYNVSRGIK